MAAPDPEIAWTDCYDCDAIIDARKPHTCRADQVPENMPANMPAEIVRKVAEALNKARRGDLGNTHLAELLLAVAEPLIREQALLDAADAFRDEGRGVMFNRAGDDLLPAQRVSKWLRDRAARGGQ